MQTAKVTDISHKGLGVIEHSDGRKLFVEGALPGDEIQYEVTELKKRFGFAKIIKIITPSASRVTPECQYHGFKPGKCGGCAWMMIDYNYQLDLKQNMLSTQAERAGIEVKQLNPIQASPKVFGYRNRAQLKTDGEKLGFVSKSSKTLASIDECLVLNQKCNSLINQLNQSLPKSEWQPQGRFKWNYIEIDDELNFEDIKINKKTSFRQANSDQNQFMKSWLNEKVKGFSKPTPVLELFSGDGNFTECLTDFSNVSAYEYSKSSIENLKLKYPHVTAESVNLFDKKSIKKILSKHKDTELLILDPPREGFSELLSLVDGLEKLKTIIYVSCDPSTWSNDLKPLISNWSVSELQAVDQFPHTPHVEILSLIEKNN
ncbi:MAG: TRAM domain-containing protein [Bdellovibrionales bacterium]|nr:TRAM domain-containing protein [Bdellovibrionales bacterium]